MSVARTSCPQFFDAPLRPAQQPVDVAAVGVGCYLSGDPGDQTPQRLGQRPVHPEDTLEGREAHLHLLADRRAPVSFLGGRRNLKQKKFLPESPTAASQI